MSDKPDETRTVSFQIPKVPISYEEIKARATKEAVTIITGEVVKQTFDQAVRDVLAKINPKIDTVATRILTDKEFQKRLERTVDGIVLDVVRESPAVRTWIEENVDRMMVTVLNDSRAEVIGFLTDRIKGALR